MVKGSYKSSDNDFRSDTVTTPSESILLAGLSSSIGDSVLNEDDDTISLEKRIAKLTGKEAGLYCVSGTLSNQVAVRTHLNNPPFSVLCDYRSHIYVHEAAGLAMLSNALVIPVKPSNGDYLTLDDIIDHIIPDDGDIHAAPTKLISLENTLHGIIYPWDELVKISEFAREHNIRIHCDGARLINASIETGISLEKYGTLFDSISICLSKSIGAPVGSVLVGASKYIKKANHFKKQNGGGIRQSGSLAMMASVAIDENYSKIKQTHENAKTVAKIFESNGIELDSPVHTNFIFIKTPILPELAEKYCEEFNVKMWLPRVSFHYQNSDEAIERMTNAVLKAVEETKKQPPRKIRKTIYKIEKDE